MKTSKITHYDPSLSIKENADINDVRPATIRSYIQSRGIDRATEKQIHLYTKIKEYAQNHPNEKAPQIAEAFKLSPNTVRRYLKMTEEPQSKKKKKITINQAEKLRFVSVSDNQSDILKTILDIHLPKLKRFQVDLTAWKLGFYKDGIPKPDLCYDKYASLLKNFNTNIEDLDNFDSDWGDGTFKSIIIDLPCSVETPTTKRRLDVSTHFSSLPILLEEHERMMRLAHRKMQTNGILVYKTMDFTFRGMSYWLSDEVLKMAKDVGFELIDKLIYIDSKHNKIDRRRTKYTASIPTHAYFFVFKKKPLTI